jgi:hypothetical protein
LLPLFVVALIPQFRPIKITQNSRVLSVDLFPPKNVITLRMFKDAEETSLLGSIASFTFENNESDEASLCPSMSLPQRLFGCALCLVVGWILSFGAFQRIILLIQGMSLSCFILFLVLSLSLFIPVYMCVCFFFPMEQKKDFNALFICLKSGIFFFCNFSPIGNPRPFVVFFSLGVILNLLSSLFITGPQKQLTQMFDEKRRYASFTLVASLGLTFYIATLTKLPGQAEVLMLLLAIQILAQMYYVVTYIPYGFDMLKSCCSVGCNKAKESISCC